MIENQYFTVTTIIWATNGPNYTDVDIFEYNEKTIIIRVNQRSNSNNALTCPDNEPGPLIFQICNAIWVISRIKLGWYSSQLNNSWRPTYLPNYDVHQVRKWWTVIFSADAWESFLTIWLISGAPKNLQFGTWSPNPINIAKIFK